MATIAQAFIQEQTPRGDGSDFVMFRFVLDTGETYIDGPRFYQSGSDLNAQAVIVGANLLESLAAHEVEQWLSA